MANKSAVPNKPAATVVETKKGLSKRGKLALIVIVVLLLLAGGISWWVQRESTSKNGADSSDSAKNPDGSPKTIQSSYARRDYQGAVDIAKEQAKKDDPASQLVLAAAYTNNKQYDEGYKIYDKLDEQGKLSGQDAMAAGEVAEGAGNKAKAITYYQKAKAKLEKDSSNRYAPRQLKFIDRRLAELQQ